MRKNKLNGKDAEQCKSIDWTEVSERIENTDMPRPKTKKKKKKKPKKDEYAWDLDDVDEDWTIDFDDNGNLIDNKDETVAKKQKDVKKTSAKGTTKKVGNSRNSASQSTEKVRKTEGVSKSESGRKTESTPKTESVKQTARVQNTNSLKNTDSTVVNSDNDVDILSKNIVSATMEELAEEDIIKGDATGTDKADKKIPRISAGLSSEDEEAIRKSVDDKIIIRSEELKAKRNVKDKNEKQNKSIFEKEEERLNKLKEKEDIIMAPSRRGANQYTNMGSIPQGVNTASEFRKNSANWRYDGAMEASNSDSEIERAIQNSDFPGGPQGFSITQAIAIITAIIVTAAGVMTTGVYANYRSEQNKIAAYAALPQFAAELTDEVPSEGEGEESIEEFPDIPFEEEIESIEETGAPMSLSLILTSVEKDLKIKLINGEDTLVKDILWGVIVTDSKGAEKHYQDEDKDGVIHLTDIGAGDYSVSIEPSEALSAYTFPTIGQEVSVRDKVEYKVIANIRDEIKKESEVNVALEDPNGGKGADVETETVPIDTVAWVESTRTEQGEEYVEANVDISKTEVLISFKDRLIAAVGNMMSNTIGGVNSRNTLAMIGSHGRMVADIFDIIGEGDDDNDDNDDDDDDDNNDDNGDEPEFPGDDEEVIGDDENAEVKTVTISRSSMQLKPGETQELVLTYTPANASPESVDWATSDSAIAVVNEGYVTGFSNGSARITATINGKIQVYCDVNVTEQKQDENIVISGPTSVAVNETIVLSASCTPFTDEISYWESSSTQIASVTGNGNNCNVTGVMGGTVKIKAVSKAGSEASFSLNVTGGKNNEYADNAQLYDSAKNKLYVCDNGEYRLAKYIDYKTGTFTRFFKKVSEVLYTGWQTIEGLTYYYTENHEKVTGEQVIGGVTYMFDNDGALSQGSGTLGIDVSKYQPSINWDSVKASGIKYVIIRCGYRGASTGSLIQDPYFVSHIKGAKAAGLKVGVYFFSTAMNEYEAVEEASMCAELCSGYGINYPVFIDVEDSTRPGYNSLSAEERTANIKAFCSTISSAGYTPGLYANKTWLTEKINTSSLSCKIWLAQYNSSGPTYTGRYDMWQYTSKGHVDGISGNVDMDQSYLGY